MTKEYFLENSIGKYISKKNFACFGHGIERTPAIKVETCASTKKPNVVVVNKIVLMDPVSMNIIDEEEANRLIAFYKTCNTLSDVIIPDISSCIRKDNNEKKQQLTLECFQKNLYMLRMRNPEIHFSAYICPHCKTVHVGKTPLSLIKTEITEPELIEA